MAGTTGTIDTGNAILDVTLGSQHVAVQSQANLPHTLSAPHQVTTTDALETSFGTTTTISAYHHGQVYISVTTDTMAITGTRGSQTGIPVHVIAADGTRSAATGLATGTYEFARLDFDSLTFTKTGTTAVGTVDARFSP